MPSQLERGATFRALHEGEPFVIPNAWDAGSARVLEGLGFRAIATTSSGFAFTLGRLDGGVTLGETVAHVRSLVAATSLPVSVDLENGYGPEPADAARAIERVAEAGAVGGSIEDWDPAGHLYERGQAAERVAAAVEAARALDVPFTLTARAENHLRGNPDLDDTVERLRAFEAVGADVLYAPGLVTLGDVRTVCGAVERPVNVLAMPPLSRLGDVFEAGAQRVSVGGQLTWVSARAFVDAATALRDDGDLDVLRSDLDVERYLR